MTQRRWCLVAACCAVVLGSAKVAVDGGAPRGLFDALRGFVALSALALAVRNLRPAAWIDGWRWVLVLLMLWTLGDVYGRVGGDGYEYYATTRSLVFDQDLDYGNDFEGLGASGVPGPDGQRTSRFPIGLSVIWVLPVMLAHGGVLLSRVFGAEIAPDGFATPYQSAATVTTFGIAMLGLLLLENVLRRRYGAAIAFWSTVAAWLATPLAFYATVNPSMSHAVSAGLAAVFVTVWLAKRGDEGDRAWLIIGAIIGLMSLVRIQDCVLIVLPILDVIRGRRHGMLRRLVALGLGPAFAAVLQFSLWAAMYGGGKIRCTATSAL